MAELEEGGFKTSLFGFKREDVLSMIESISAENLQKEAESQSRIDELEKKLDLLSQNYNDLLDKAHQISGRLTAEQKKNKELRTKMDDMEDELLLAKEWNETYKVEFDKRENSVKEAAEIKAAHEKLKAELEQQKADAVEALQKEIDLLKGDAENQKNRAHEEAVAQVKDRVAAVVAENERVKNQLLDENKQLKADLADCQQKLEAEIQNRDGLTAETREAREKAELEARKMVEDARLRAESAESFARQTVEAHRQKMANDAQGIAVGVAVMKDRLSNVDSRIANAQAELQNCTGAIYAALNQAEKDLEDLGVQMKRLSNGEKPDMPLATRTAPQPVTEPAEYAAAPVAPAVPVAPLPQATVMPRLSKPELKVVNARPEPELRAEPDYKLLSQNLIEALGRMMNE